MIDAVVVTLVVAVLTFLSQLLAMVLSHVRILRLSHRQDRIGDQVRVAETKIDLARGDVAGVHQLANSHTDRLESRILELEALLRAQGQQPPPQRPSGSPQV